MANDFAALSIPTRQTGFGEALARRWRIWTALFFRDATGEEQNFGYLFRLVEPGILILATVALSWLVNRHAPYGDSMLLFAVTGVAPLYMFAHISMQVSRQPAVKLPFHSDMDQCVVTGFIEMYFATMAMIILMAFLYFTQTSEARPIHIGHAVMAWFTVGIFAMGVGLVGRTLSRLYPVWDYAYPALARIMVHLSGVYYIVDNLPPKIRWYIALNPLVHGVTWFRLGFYNTFPTFSFSLGYYLWWALVTFVLGLIAEGWFENWTGER